MIPTYEIIQGDSLQSLCSMQAESVHCVVTSPPYWGQRDYGVVGQLGLERTPAEYVRNQVEIFREVRRVLRSDGTLWLNLGDTYQSAKGQSGGVDPKQPARRHGLRPNDVSIPGLKPKDLVGIPWRVAFALQEDGWWLRDCIIWHKPNPMPGSQTDRTCTSHEYIFLLAKSRRYFFDQNAICEPTSTKSLTVNTTPRKGTGKESTGEKVNQWMSENGGRYHPEMRNPRSVWRIACKSYKGAHFATFPVDLPTKCIKAGTSAHGVCSVCGAPWLRQIEKFRKPTRPGTNSKIFKGDADPTIEGLGWNRANRVGNRDPQRHVTGVRTIGWTPSCQCDGEIINATVLDVFNGSGTTGKAAMDLGRDYIGLELNPHYIELTHERLKRAPALF